MTVKALEPQPKKQPILLATPPAFLTQKQAGKYLGHSGEWLRTNGLRHPLYRPSCGVSRRGVTALYDMDHLNIIRRHMNNPDVFTEDDAYRKWLELNLSSIRAVTAPTHERKGRK